MVHGAGWGRPSTSSRTLRCAVPYAVMGDEEHPATRSRVRLRVQRVVPNATEPTLATREFIMGSRA